MRTIKNNQKSKLTFFFTIKKHAIRKYKMLLVVFSLVLLTIPAPAQETAIAVAAPAPSFEIGAVFGYDLPLFNTPYKELKYKGGRYIGAHADYHFPSNFGIRVEYANIITSPNILIPDVVYYAGQPAPTVKNSLNIKRQFVGIGPSYLFRFGNSRFSALIAPLAGYSWIAGGDALVESSDPKIPGGATDTHLVNTGFKDNAIAAKMDLDFSYHLGEHFKINLGLYYLRHFAVNFDNTLDINPPGGVLSIHHGENIYDHAPAPYTVTSEAPWVLMQNIEKVKCMDLSSVGANLGISYRFGKRSPKKDCNVCCPNDGHKVVVTVRDDLSKKVIPESDVAIKDMSGNIIATGTTNSFGVVDFGQIPHNNYVVTGMVYGIETTTASILDEEFVEGAIIQKEILYTDIRFILKGKTINKGTHMPEPNVIATLSHLQTRDVKQDNSDGVGAFSFRLDKNSAYEVVGIKENRLSNIERVSTVGLSRSTTLFVDLELGMDDFDCGAGTVLDIKYSLDSHDLSTAAKYELDRLVRYLNDHHYDRVELGSHTDSRGSTEYNKGLAERRANSAVEYIVSKGIPRSRIIAEGYGESQLLNRCSDGVNCSEQEHAINRRTEAKLLCN